MTFWIIEKTFCNFKIFILKCTIYCFHKPSHLNMFFLQPLLPSSLRFMWRFGHCPTCFSASLQVELKYILTANVCSWREVMALFRNAELSDLSLLVVEQWLQTWSFATWLWNKLFCTYKEYAPLYAQGSRRSISIPGTSKNIFNRLSLSIFRQWLELHSISTSLWITYLLIAVQNISIL